MKLESWLKINSSQSTKNNFYLVFFIKKKITSDVLFGNIGGNLGLFVGMSILSFIEMIEVIIQLILVLINDKKKEI